MKKVLLIITSFISIDENGKNYVQRELETLCENNIENEFNVKFFHPIFQGLRTLDRFIENYGDQNWVVLFLEEIDEEQKDFYKKLISNKKKDVKFAEKLTKGKDLEIFEYFNN